MRNLIQDASILLWLGFAAGCEAAPARQPEVCDAGGGQAASVVEIGERFELVLDTGAHLRLAGVEPVRAAGSGLAREARERLAAWLVGAEISFRPLAEGPDRWGRQEASVFAPAAPGGALISVAGALFDAGYARVLPEPAIRACAPQWLKQEAGARAAGRGLWADPAHAILDAANRESFEGRGGEFVIVEGAVSGVGETRARTYVNFGPIRTVDFAATLRRQTLTLVAAAGHRPVEFTGRRLRVRGQLDTRFGPQIEISDPAAIEFPGEASLLPQSGPLARR